VVNFFDGNKVEVVDAWTARISYTGPNDIIQPTVEARQHMNNHHGFKELKSAVVNQRSVAELAQNKHSYEWLCWGYEQVIPFPDVAVYSEDPRTKDAIKYATQAPNAENIIEPDEEALPKPPAQQAGMTWALFAGAIAMLLFL